MFIIIYHTLFFILFMCCFIRPLTTDHRQIFFNGKGGRTKGESKYASVGLNHLVLCCCSFISLLSSHKYE